MSTKVTDLTPLAATPDDTDVLHIVDVGDNTGGGSGTSKKITVSNLLSGAAGTITSVNGQTGPTVSLAVDNLTDVNAASPSNNDVLKWTAGATNKWQPVDWLAVLYAEFKQGLDTTITNGSGTTSELELTATTAKLKTGISEIKITETSPADIDFIVATDATGSTAHTAVVIDGSTTASQTDIRIKNGSRLQIESPTRSAWIRNTATADTTIGLPSTTGTLALTSDIPAAGIAAVVDDTSPQLGGNLDVQAREIDTSTTNGNIIVAPNGTGVLEVKGDTNDGAIQLNCNQNSHGVKIQSPPHSAAASYTLVLPDDTGTNGQVMTTDGSGNLSFTTVSGGGGGTVTAVTGTAPIVSSGGNTPAISINTATTAVKGAMSAADKVLLNTIAGAFVSDDAGGAKNVAFESTGGISASAGVIVSMLQDTTADNTNANSKDFLGVVTSTSDTCVINGLVEITGQIPNGATAGRPLWLGTSGTFSAAAPTATNAYARVVGHYVGAISAGSYGVFFNPSNDWIQIS